MRISFGVLAALFLATTAAEALAQQPSAAKPAKPTQVLAVSGCISAAPDARKVFTLADATQGQTYRLTGTDVREYAGQHVEILGAPSKRVRVVGGLYPSPNVAAQAGAIDPTQAAVASESGTANIAKPPVEFTVKSVRVTPGGCPAR
jgi:hypothetical protein